MDTRTFPPRVSIVISTYNRAHCLGKAIESALDQALPVAEVLIIDDGSTDDTEAVAASFNSDKLCYLKKENGGLSDARNHGVKEAKGDYIIWLDDDDLLLPHTHEAYIATLSKDPDIDIVYGDYQVIDAENNEQYVLNYDEFYRNNAFFISRLLSGNRIPHGGSMWHKSVYEKYGLYDVSLKGAPDYDLFARIAAHALFKHSGPTVYVYNLHGRNMSIVRHRSERIPERTIVKRIIERFSLKQLFPTLDWTNAEAGRAKAHILIGNVFARYGDYSAVYIYIKETIEVLEKHSDNNEEDLASAYISLGNVYLHDENYRKALEYYDKSIKINKTTRAYYKLAHVHNKLGNFETAGQYYKKTLDLTPDHKAAGTELEALVTCLSTQ